MPAAVKAIVFKTAKLKATREFFENILKLPVKESSVRHFVIHSKNLRLVFIETPGDFEVEMYVDDKSNRLSGETELGLNTTGIKSCKDPNGIKIIIA